MSFQNDHGQDESWSIELESAIIKDVLLGDTDFLHRLALLIRDLQVKDARGKGNLFAQWAATNPPPRPNKQRLS